MTGRFLTEPEAAQTLRCSTSKIKRLRLSGRLPYVAGRPVLIAEADLGAFIDAHKRQNSDAEAKPKAPAGDSDEAARKWALQAVLLKRPRAKS